MRRAASWIVVTLALGLIGGCGWQLRGAGGAALDGRALAIESPADTAVLVRTVRRELATLGAETVAPERAEQVLVLLGERTRRRVLAEDDRGHATEYELGYTLSYRLADAGGKVVRSREVATAEGSYRASGDDALAEQSRRERLTDELRAEAVRLMLARVAAVAPDAAPPEP
ncbi:LPS assembly lipoprotein LptE [Arhodomonas sp. AD133]|uniref:LPS-assembly lipoprotein LptE n=1 Tax=Arhodomonas sp. AD133 TaxID=3415009 RepID=UPI003EB85D41